MMRRMKTMLESLYAVQYGKGFKYGGPDFSFLFYVAKVKGEMGSV